MSSSADSSAIQLFWSLFGALLIAIILIAVLSSICGSVVADGDKREVLYLRGENIQLKEEVMGLVKALEGKK